MRTLPCLPGRGSLKRVTDRDCIRCHMPVLLQDGQLVFCSHCGAPQIFLSEQMQSELEDQARAFAEQNDSALPGLQAGGEGDLQDLQDGRKKGLFGKAGARGQDAWTLGVQYALLSAAVALALGLLSLLLPPASLFLLLWIVSAPILTVAFLNARPGSLPVQDLGFAARLGLLTGLLVTLCSGLVFTLNLVLSRFLLHDTAALDTQLAAAFAQQRTAVLARLGAEAKPTLDLLAVPEFRVGLLLAVLLLSAFFYLLLSTVAGALAGFVLRRRPGA